MEELLQLVRSGDGFHVWQNYLDDKGTRKSLLPKKKYEIKPIMNRWISVKLLNKTGLVSRNEMDEKSKTKWKEQN